MMLRATTRWCGELTTVRSAPRSASRDNVHERETGRTRSRLDGRAPEDIDEQMLLDAAQRAAALKLESAAKRAQIRLRVLGAALDWLAAGNKSTTTRLLGVTFDESGIRTGMERAYRDLARETTGTWERIALVEKANAVRPRTRV